MSCKGWGALEQWVARLLGGPARARGDGKKEQGGVQAQERGPETEASGRARLEPGARSRLRQLLGSCLHALVRITPAGTPPTEQEARVDALQNVAKQLLRRLGSADSRCRELATAAQPGVRGGRGGA